ncbi:sugar ABC transporter substrate-binding protein [Planctomonas sp. JC2975]|uniref:ABC transporter substrate-binding protein n=1 Tax=Planctomonas sp. JC2975 TaxID=2729626 RepID=UPI001472F36B|nr:sugar ABC transporter substrate-binding protein [Planctomonas sp. JC2975]NNC14028.1 sugar ABC transporter substrate-binding protein [Planctomonas sp. JC2975]
MSKSASGGHVTLDFWGWAPGYADSVKLWNASHPDVQVKFSTIPSGGGGGYTKIQAAVKAGTAPCLAQVGDETLPTFVASGALADISSYANASADKFVKWTWNQVSVGGKVVAIPVDTGPMAMFYRTDILQKDGIAVPTTWQEFKDAATAFKATGADNYLTTSPQDAYDVAAYSWQAGGSWFGIDGDSWKVSIDNPQTQKVAAYWQGLLGAGLVKSEPPLAEAWNKDAALDRIPILIAAVWAAPLLQTALPDQAGKWAVAPMPQWTSGKSAAGNNGGSTTAVLKGCKNLKEATEFATWFSTNKSSVANLIAKTGIYPASKSALEMPELNKPSAYYGGQDIYSVFRDAAANTDTDWRWGPTMTQVESDFTDGIGKATTGTGALPEVVTSVQKSTVTEMKSQGLSVTQ